MAMHKTKETVWWKLLLSLSSKCHKCDPRYRREDWMKTKTNLIRHGRNSKVIHLNRNAMCSIFDVITSRPGMDYGIFCKSCWENPTISK
ncbi:hypothetical protein MKX03_001292 [Papaver bracteatum]|nr:hypothetical protein MKX03_001292 [Papaver bracteatum]